MPSRTYDPRYDLIALDNMKRWTNFGPVKCSNDFSKKYYDSLWLWTQKYSTLVRLRKEYMPEERSVPYK